MTRARTFAPRGRGPKRMTSWSSYDGVATSLSSGGATVLSGIAFEAPGTLIRTRGIVMIRPVTPVSADVLLTGAFGIGIVSAEAFAAGVASIPEPATDSDWGGWMVIQPWSFQFEFGDQSSFAISSINIEVDSKAMRKVEPNSVAVVVVESIIGAATVVDMTRLLLKLH